MKRNKISVLLLSALMIVSVTAYPIETDIGKTNVLVVTGNADTTVTPDIAILYSYVQTEGKTATQATDKAQKIVNQVIRNLQGIATKADIGTSFYSVFPKYDFSSGNPVIVGYNVYQSLTIRIKGISDNNNKISRAIDLIAQAGVSSISGITYDVSDEEKGKSQARRLAYQEASNAAAQYARLTGRKIGKILKIDQSTPAFLLPLSTTSFAPQTATLATSIPITEIAVRVAVVIVYQLL